MSFFRLFHRDIESILESNEHILIFLLIYHVFPYDFSMTDTVPDVTMGYPQDRAKRFMACLDAVRQRQLRLLASLEADETGTAVDFTTETW